MLKHADGSVRGVAAADVYLDSISQIVSNISIEDTGSLYAYAGEQIKAGKTGLCLYEDTYLQIAEVEGSSWIAVAFVSRSEVLSELYDLTRAMTTFSVIAVLVLTFLVIVLTHRIIGRPVKELSKVATRIAEGELGQTIRYKSSRFPL